MPRLLAIETSTDRGSIALLDGRESVCRVSPQGTAHSTWVLPAIRGLLSEADVAMETVDAIAFGSGPGSFTGLRLACGIAQGLALGIDRPVIGVCSLEAVALACGAQRVWVGVDARMREMYFAGYAVTDDSVETLIAPDCAAPELVPVPAGVDWLAAGSAFVAYADVLVPRLSACCTRIESDVVPSAEFVARLAAGRFARGEACDPALAAPLYVRDKVALTTAERLARGGRV